MDKRENRQILKRKLTIVTFIRVVKISITGTRSRKYGRAPVLNGEIRGRAWKIYLSKDMMEISKQGRNLGKRAPSRGSSKHNI